MRSDKGAVDLSLNYALFPVMDRINYLSLKSSYLFYSKKNWYTGASLEAGMAFLGENNFLPKRLVLPNFEVLFGKEFYDPSKSHRRKFIQMGVSLLPLFFGTMGGEPDVALSLTLGTVLFSYGVSF
jgi:hypothetical protein